MKNSANGLNSKLDTAQQKINDRVIETTQNEAQEEKRLGEKSLSDNVRHQVV